MNKENLPDELFDWLADKSYQDLDPTEKAVVDQSIGQKEYEALHLVVGDVQAMHSPPIIEQPTVKVKIAKPAAWQRILWYPIPAYQVAAGVLLLLFSTLAFRHQWRAQSPSANDPTEVVVKGIPIDQDNYPEALVFEL